MSTSQASELDNATRSDLIARAEALGIEKADVLTRAELVDEIVKRTVADPLERRLARGLLGVARDLVARVVERGLHLPDAAALIRGLQQVTLTPNTPPIATVTLAEIYAGQGHRTRALAVLDEVLAKEPEHTAARTLRQRVATLPEDRAPIPSSEPPPDTTERPLSDAQPEPAALDGEPPPDAALAEDHRVALEPEPVADFAPEPTGDFAVARAIEEPASDFTAAPEPEPDLGFVSDFASELPGELERDTIPPTADALPTALPPDLPTWHAPADEGNAPSDRSPSLEPGFGIKADEIVLVPIDETSALARWELGAASLDGVRARSQKGELILRIVAVTPSWDGPKVEIRDIEVALPIGDWCVCDLPAKAVLRAAIGWRGERGFEPLAVALDVAPSKGESVGRPAEGRALSSWRTLALAPWEASYEETRPASFDTH